jgi:hypothetical protein
MRRKPIEAWIRVESRTAAFAVAYIGTQIIYGAPYGMAIVRKRGIWDIFRFRAYFARRGCRMTLLA